MEEAYATSPIFKFLMKSTASNKILEFSIVVPCPKLLGRQPLMIEYGMCIFKNDNKEKGKREGNQNYKHLRS